jgi:GDP-4-dehydro-6-deoxy-D-mannose reductase
VVRAYVLILEKGAKGEAYNVCSGTAVPLTELLAMIVARSGRKITIEQDPARIKKHKNASKSFGDRSKITRATGWEPEIPLTKTLDDLHRYWLSSLSKPAV